MRGDVTDSGIMRVLSKICDIVCLNVLWLVCSLPIITIGASTTALYTVMLKLVKNEEGYIFKGFLHAFKLNFKQSTIIWLILLLCGGVCFVDYRISEMMPGTLGMVFKSVFLLLAFFLISVKIYYAEKCAPFNGGKITLYNFDDSADSRSGCFVVVEYGNPYAYDPGLDLGGNRYSCFY